MFAVLVAVLAVLFVLLPVVTIVEMVLAVRQGFDKDRASRPSTWLTFAAVVARGVFSDLGWIQVKILDIVGWVPRIGHFLRRLLFSWIPQEVAERALKELQWAMGSCFRAPLAYFDGLTSALWDSRCPWFTWPLFVVVMLSWVVAIEMAAIYYDVPFFIWPTWYLGLVGRLILVVYEAAITAFLLLCDFPAFLVRLATLTRDLVPEKVRVGLLNEMNLLFVPWASARELARTYPIASTLILFSKFIAGVAWVSWHLSASSAEDHAGAAAPPDDAAAGLADAVGVVSRRGRRVVLQ